MNNDPIVRKSEFAKICGVNKTTLWRWEKKGLIPKPIRIGGVVGWPRSVVETWKIEQGWPVKGAAD